MNLKDAEMIAELADRLIERIADIEKAQQEMAKHLDTLRLTLKVVVDRVGQHAENSK